MITFSSGLGSSSQTSLLTDPERRGTPRLTAPKSRPSTPRAAVSSARCAGRSPSPSHFPPRRARQTETIFAAIVLAPNAVREVRTHRTLFAPAPTPPHKSPRAMPKPQCPVPALHLQAPRTEHRRELFCPAPTPRAVPSPVPARIPRPAQAAAISASPTAPPPPRPHANTPG